MTSKIVKQGDRSSSARRARFENFADGFFFLFAGVAATWLVVATITDSRRSGWTVVIWVVLIWAFLAYLILPRLHRLLTSLYVPEYFIGRARTTSGLLGDPINLALNGTRDQIESAFSEAGWHRADPITARSSGKIVLSTLLRKTYPNAPVSTLQLFGREQDFSYQQEVAGNPAQRHHIRFWRCPDQWPLPGGDRVAWLAPATFDRRVGLSLFTLQVTHKISEDTDQERDHVLESLKQVDSKIKVRVLEDFSTAYHARNGGGDTIRTNGNLPVLHLQSTPPTGNVTRATTEAPSGNPHKQHLPVAVVAALFLILGEVISQIHWVVRVLRHQGEYGDQLSSVWASLSPGGQITADGATHLSALIAALLAALFAALGFLLFKGYQSARLLLMAVTTAAILPAVISWIIRASSGPVHVYLVPSAIAVPLLLLLSSVPVRAYTSRLAEPGL